MLLSWTSSIIKHSGVSGIGFYKDNYLNSIPSVQNAILV